MGNRNILYRDLCKTLRQVAGTYEGDALVIEHLEEAAHRIEFLAEHACQLAREIDEQRLEILSLRNVKLNGE